MPSKLDQADSRSGGKTKKTKDTDRPSAKLHTMKTVEAVTMGGGRGSQGRAGEGIWRTKGFFVLRNR